MGLEQPIYDMAELGGLPLPPTEAAKENPYLSYAHQTSHGVSELEAEVLGEYARLAKNIEKLTGLTNTLSTSQPEIFEQLRPLEKKLGLVLTLFKASVWATYVAQEAREEQEDYEAEQHRLQR